MWRIILEEELYHDFRINIYGLCTPDKEYKFTFCNAWLKNKCVNVQVSK